MTIIDPSSSPLAAGAMFAVVVARLDALGARLLALTTVDQLQWQRSRDQRSDYRDQKSLTLPPLSVRDIVPQRWCTQRTLQTHINLLPS